MSEELAHIDELKSRLTAELESLNSFALDGLSLVDAEAKLRSIGDLKVSLTGKKSDLAALKKRIGTVAAAERAAFAQAAQALEKKVTTAIESAENVLKAKITDLRTESERLDVTIPGRRPRRGHLHPVTLLRQRIEDVFVSMGYAIEDDREIETDYYNFDALNIPEGHPARESQDTFYTTTGLALRSQTSTVQIRAMERRGVPLRILAPGKVFRRDTPDMTHTPMFHQLEGLCVDKGITMAHLKGTVTEWLRRMYGPETITRFRPSYFPFTEPSAEFDFSCFKCGGTGRVSSEQRAVSSGSPDSELLTANRSLLTDRCRPCKGSGWIELGGSGMVHPNVLRAVGVDPTIYSGFAFGFGLERMTALMYTIDDIRHLFENDVRFLEQFS
jgi:phenylalanyl-tRNA synthetase alpha chain